MRPSSLTPAWRQIAPGRTARSRTPCANWWTIQGRNDDAALVEQRFKAVWKDADITLTASRIGS
jgi:hypothetical protein